MITHHECTAECQTHSEIVYVPCMKYPGICFSLGVHSICTKDNSCSS